MNSSALAYSVRDACLVACTGRTSIYEAIRAGELRAVKRGARTLILEEDLRRWVQSLPPITVKQLDTAPSKRGMEDHKDRDNGAAEKSNPRERRAVA